MMQILVAAATELEIAPFIKQNPTADVLITGVGAPAAIYQLTKRLHLVDYNIVIQAGIAGSFVEYLVHGEVVKVKTDVFADLGILDNGYFTTIFQSGLADANAAPFKDGWLMNAGNFPVDINYKEVNGVTVNTITNDLEQINRLSSTFNAEIESMEGAALHYVCLQQEVHFLQLRSISNSVGERDKSKWKITESLTSLNVALQEVYDKLIKTTFSD